MKVVFLLTLAPLLCWGTSERVCVSKRNNQCQFPFTYKGRTYDQCTTFNSENGEPWCQTIDGRFEDCEAYCPGASCYDESEGVLRDHKEAFPRDCNTCSCFAGGIGCTYIGCDGGGAAGGTCFDEEAGVLREDGDSWERDCNTCNCNGGNIGCTLAFCPPKPPSNLCECINPFSGADQQLGDPDITCSRGQGSRSGRTDPFCYVDCNSDCRDKKPAKGRGRCYSTLACNPGVAYDVAGR